MIMTIRCYCGVVLCLFPPIQYIHMNVVLCIYKLLEIDTAVPQNTLLYYSECGRLV